MTPDDRSRLLKFCRLLASDQDGERGTAASMANKLAEKLGGWDRVIAQAGAQQQQPNPHHNRESRPSYSDAADAMDKMWRKYAQQEAQRAAQADNWAYWGSSGQDDWFHKMYEAAARQEREKQQYQRTYGGGRRGGKSASWDDDFVRQRQQAKEAEAAKQEQFRQAQEAKARKRQSEAEQMAYDELFNKNFAKAHAAGHSFPQDFTDKSQWDEADIIRLKQQMEIQMRSMGIWDDKL